MILVRLVIARLLAVGGGGKALACHLLGGDYVIQYIRYMRMVEIIKDEQGHKG